MEQPKVKVRDRGKELLDAAVTDAVLHYLVRLHQLRLLAAAHHQAVVVIITGKSQGTRAPPIKEPTVPMISSASTTCRAPMVSFLRMEIGATPHKNHPSRR